MKVQIVMLLLFFYFNSHAQIFKSKEKYYRFAVLNSHTAKPFGSFSSLLYKEYHPGFEVSTGRILTNQNKHQWAADFTLGYLWHRWVQHNISLSLNGGYRHLIGKDWGATSKLGAGYQLSVPTHKVYSIDNGLKQKTAPLRSQFIVSFSLVLDKKIGKKGVTIFSEYQQKIQTPFINEYVPWLPYNTLLAGIIIPIHKTFKQ